MLFLNTTAEFIVLFFGGKNEIQEIEEEALEERKSKAITLLQELPNETICEIVNHFEERLKTGESENKK